MENNEKKRRKGRPAKNADAKSETPLVKKNKKASAKENDIDITEQINNELEQEEIVAQEVEGSGGDSGDFNGGNGNDGNDVGNDIPNDDGNGDSGEDDFPIDKASTFNDIPDENWNPLNEPVMERGYTDGSIDINANPASNVEERVIPPPKYDSAASNTAPDFDSDFINEQMGGEKKQEPEKEKKKKKNINNDIPNDDSPKGADDSGGSGGSGSGGSGGSGGGTGGSSSTPPANKDVPPKGDNLKDLSPAEKKEAVAKTADMILMGYKQYCPIPFIWVSSYNIKKIEKLHDNDEINHQMLMGQGGTTFYEYVGIFNDKVSEAFDVTDEEIEQLRQPLIDVLSEKEIAATPTQILLGTLMTQLTSKAMLAYKFFRERSNDIRDMKAMHAEKMEELRFQREARENENKKKQPPASEYYQGQPIYTTSPPPPQSVTPPIAPQYTAQAAPPPPVPEAKVVDINPKKEEVVKEPTLEDALNSVEEQKSDTQVQETKSDVIHVTATEIIEGAINDIPNDIPSDGDGIITPDVEEIPND